MVSASRLLQPRTFAVLVCLWGLLASSAQGAEVRLSASSSKAWVGLPLTVTLEIRNASSHDAPLLPEVDNADVQSRGQIGNSTQLSIINGRRSQTQTVTYAWDLTPRAPGPVSVPPFAVRVDGLDQQVLGMTLDAATPEVGDRVSVEVRASDTEVYVGQPLELTLELNVKAFTDSRYGYAFTANNHWSLIDLQASRWGPFAASLNETRGSPEGGDTVRRPDAQGQPADYFQYRVRARVYPDRAGPLELAGDGVRIVGQYPEAIRVRRGAFGDSLELDGALPVAVRVPNPKVNVRPVPTAGRPDTYRGAVGRYRITAAADPLSVAVGDAVTLQLIVVGDGPLDRLSAPPLEAIPELTRDFDVTSGPIAGVVQDGAKVFTTTIRPRREDVSAVPAIPLVSFDLDTESFVTTASEPITLAVRPAERLSLDGLTDGPDSATAADPMPDTAGAGVPARPVWLPLPARPSDGPVWPWIWPVLYVAVPGAAGLAWGLWRGVARLRGRGGAVAARAVARARRRLRRARDAEGVAAALRGYVAQTTGRSAAALTAADAHAALAAQHPDLDAEALSTFAAALRAAEAAACGAAAAPTEALAERGRSALDAVTARRRGASVPVAVLCLLGALSAGAQADPPTSAPAAPGVSEHRASAQRFAQAPPGAASLINAATAWNLADQPARARP